ncbi:TetR/AcrR family transcriptional regulator [Geomonas sp. Red32]|uniref:TetR/AcrR family transcriptional regulator n=1 Tax=Geomonas sp. Red32 TaxID=2912856 RepID=UPI00202CE69E|nr:TetR/AcrR family transcriptional regulator [Geomonas sp. Red32]MCM0082447.1 TetR/AcrR family transcriptional regulator [Geomonas sp. Red32]
MKKSDKRSEILSIGTEMIALQGYNGTGIDAVLKRAGVPKGSFYHYFGSKEDFGLAIIDQFAVRYDQYLASFLDDPAFPPLDRIRNYLEKVLAYLTGTNFAKGCLIGNLGQELADQNERFRERLDQIFHSWKERFAACLKEAQQQGGLTPRCDPAVIAGFFLSGWEGAILRAKVMKSPQPLRDFIDTMYASVFVAK